MFVGQKKAPDISPGAFRFSALLAIQIRFELPSRRAPNILFVDASSATGALDAIPAEFTRPRTTLTRVEQVCRFTNGGQPTLDSKRLRCALISGITRSVKRLNIYADSNRPA